MNDLITTFSAAIMADDTLTAWAAVEYDKTVMVFENYDSRNEPGENDCPLVILYPSMKSGGIAQGDKYHVIGITCVVYDSAMPETVDDVLRFTGGYNVDEMRSMVLDVIKANIPANMHLDSVLSEYNTIEQFPYVSVNMELTFSEPKTIGSDPYE